jgi:glutamate-ammonia-ligase adenylyltransferase
MAREPGLHALAQYGFVNLSDARETLDARGWSGDWFRFAASPDKALAWLSRLVDADDGELLETLSDSGSQLREGLVRVLGASDGLAEFLLRSPVSAGRALAPETLPSADEYRSDMLGRPGLTSDSLRHAYREQLVTVAAWDLMQPSATRAVQSVGEALADLADATVNAAVELARSTLAVRSPTLS